MIKLTDNIVSFSSGNTDVYEKFVDYFRHYHKIGKYTEEVSLEEKEAKVNEAIEAEVSRYANVPEGISFSRQMTNPVYMWAKFAVIGALVDAVLPDAIINSIGMYADVRFGGFGDSFSFDITPRDLFVVSKTGMGKKHGEVQKQFEGQVVVIPEFRDVTVQASYYKMLSGKEDLAMFAMKAAKSIEAQMTIDAFTVFNTAMEALDNAGDDALRFAGYTQSTLVEAAQKVSAWNGGNKAIVLGTQLALQNILPTDANYRYDLESDYAKIGYVKTAFGYDVMALPQVADYRTPFKLALDDNNVYIISPTAGKLVKHCIEGETLAFTDAPSANANLMVNATMKKAYGTAVATSAVGALIELS